MKPEVIYERLDMIKYILQGMNSTNVHEKKARVKEICDAMQMTILEEQQ